MWSNKQSLMSILETRKQTHHCHEEQKERKLVEIEDSTNINQS